VAQRPTKVCPGCGETFAYRTSVDPMFCSLACLSTSARQERICEECGASFSILIAHARRAGRGRFCSRACKIIAQTTPLEQRFWSKVNKDGPIPEHRPEFGPCWEWTAARDMNGYGVIDNKKAHRVSMKIHGLFLPDDLLACHHCDNPPCIRPTHLFAGTNADNMADMVSKRKRSHEGIP
jgi:hypothetical protein